MLLQPAALESHVQSTTESTRLAFSVRDGARMISVSERQLYVYIAAGLVKSVKIGGRRLIRKEALESMLIQAEALAA